MLGADDESGVTEGSTASEFTAHARFERARRGIRADVVHQVLATPELRPIVPTGADNSAITLTTMESRMDLVQVVDVDRRPAEVVTVYRTSKVTRYWVTDPCA